MIDNEELGQRKDVVGEGIAVCDLCGRPISAPVPVRLSGKQAMAEPIERLSICASCMASLEQDDVPFEEEAGDVLQIPSLDER